MVPAVIATGLANETVCQPLTVSPVAVAVASWVPEVFHSDTTCWPVLAAAL